MNDTYEDRPFGQTNRGVNNRLGPSGPEYPPEWDRPERDEPVMTPAEQEAWTAEQERESRPVRCPQCGERPTLHPEVPCEDCRRSDAELTGELA